MIPENLLTEKAKIRLEVCRTCEKLINDSRCSHCGCFMKVKVLVPLATCPENKWGFELKILR
jgi:hypothetical protein